MTTKTDDSHDNKRLEAEFQALVRSVPTQSPIFLPTERFELKARVDGLKKVKHVYDVELDGQYRKALRGLRDRFKGRERCFVIGNGPSLNETDLACLKDEVTFAVNGFFLKARELEWQPTFYVVEDHLVAEDRREWINALKGPTKLFPAYLAYCLDEGSDTIFFNHRPRKSYPHGFDFSTDAAEITYAGCTVTFTALQLAAYLGFKEIYLLGVDADYDVPADAAHSKSYGVGVIDMKSDDPNHFHPDYFGKGFRWHDPQVDKMVEAYKEARKVIDQTEQRIYNAGIGGRLEVFDRRSFQALFPHARSGAQLQEARDKAQDLRRPVVCAPLEDAPRLLVLDITRCGDGTATGELKGTLLAEWPAERLMQVSNASRVALNMTHCGETIELSEGGTDWADLVDAVTRFDPQVILYRPVPNSGVLHGVAMSLIERFGVPVVTWIMDDWPADLAQKDARQFAVLDADWRSLVARSARCLAISDAMCVEMQQRYGVPFTACANAIDPADWPRPRTRPPGTFRVRYAGSLAENMSLKSVKLVAEAVEALASEGIDIVLELRTSSYWSSRAAPHFDRFKSTFIVPRTNGDSAEYKTWLSEADVLLIAYNFDEESLRYTKYSMANKLPECLASGAVVLGVGPRGHATMDVLTSSQGAVVITQPDVETVRDALRRLKADPFHRLDLAERAQAYAFTHKRVDDERRRFADTLKSASVPVLTYPRSSHAHVDETHVVSVILQQQTGAQNVLVDVGAHIGSSAAYFDKLDWTIICFEPDPSNRAKLQQKFGTRQNVTIDPRAVSDKPEEGRSYFASDESTGISGMLNFRETHKEVAKVEVTTVAEAAKTYGFKRIDFLKIDVEGYDFSVLKGVPWNEMRPRVIECEFEDAKTKLLGHTVLDMAAYLSDKGYAVYISEWHPIVRYGQRHDWFRLVRYPDLKPEAEGWGNILAFDTDPGEEVVVEAFRKCMKVNVPRAKTAEVWAPAVDANPSTSAAVQRGASGESRREVVKAKGAEQMKSMYTGFAVWAENNSPTVLALGRLVKRCAAMAQRNLALSGAAATGAFLGLVAFVAMPGLRVPLMLLAATGLVGAGLMFLWRRQRVLRQELQTVRANVNSLSGKLKSAETKLKTTDKTLDAIGKRGDQASKSLTEMQRELDPIKTELMRQAAQQMATASMLGSLRQEGGVRATGAASVPAGFRLEDIGTGTFAEAASIKVKLDTMVAALAHTPALNMAMYQSFNRQVNDSILRKLQDWATKLNLPYNARALAYLANRICLLESRMHGRLATNIEDIMLRSLVAKAAGGEPREVLEIGTLFGVGAAALHEFVLFDNRGIHLTLLDPLDGYYGKDNSDIITSQPINEKVLRKNFEIAGVNMADVTLIKKFSHEAEAQEETGRKRYDMLIIDGDHSYEGVKLDYEVYLPFVKVGGFVIIDDYTSPSWPDVTRYVDETVKLDARVELVGAEWRTAVFKVRDPAAVTT